MNSKNNYIYIVNTLDLDTHLENVAFHNLIAIDTETTGLCPHTNKIRLLQISCESEPTLIIDLFKTEVTDLLIKILASEHITKIFHNGIFDIQMLWGAGIPVSPPYFDTQLASILVDNGLGLTHSLKVVTHRHLGIELDKTEQDSNWSVPKLTSEQLDYAAEDALVLLPLERELSKKIKNLKLERARDIEFGCLTGAAMLEFKGMKLDLPQLKVLQKEYSELKKKLKAELENSLQLDDVSNSTTLPLFPSEYKTKINLNSHHQVKKAFNLLGVPLTSTDKDHLSIYIGQNELIQKFVDYRKANDYLTKYLNKLERFINPKTGRIHTSVFQIGAATGRMSVRNPPLQQIPNNTKFRSLFVPEEGYDLIVADYSQMELRIIAEVCGDETLTLAYQQGLDIHSLTASVILDKPLDQVTKEDRRLAKPVNFGLVYGMMPASLVVYARSNYGVAIAQKEAEEISAKFFKRFPGLLEWHKQIKSQNTKIVRTLSGRIRKWSYPAPFTEAVNTPVQGLNADITKLAVSLLWAPLIKYDACIIALVHDEIVVEVPHAHAVETRNLVVELMQQAGSTFLRHIPCVVDAAICKSWAEKA